MKIDPTRIGGYEPLCIPIRALDPRTEQWGSFDVAKLDKESLIEWLSKRDLNYVKDVVGILLGHGHITDKENNES